MSRVAVLGRGIAGAAATWAARRAGATVLGFGGPALASAMTSGAADDEPWELDVPARDLDEQTAAFFDALGGWVFPERSSALLATAAGVLRPARGHDAHVLDLASAGPGVVGLPRLLRPGWDADAHARAWNDEPLARTRGLRFEAFDADLLHRTDEQVLPDVDLAVRLEDPARRKLLDAKLDSLARSARFVALLVPPGLGLRDSGALRVGEILSPPGGPAGRRLGLALERTLAKAHGGLSWVRANSGRSARLVVAPLAEPPAAREAEVEAVVLAVGGMVGGGIAYRRTDPAAVLSPIPSYHAESFPTALVGQHADGAAIELPLGEPRWSPTSGGPLERVGILHRSTSVRRDDGGVFAHVFVAGDAAAGRARTLLTAVRDGLAAGAAAANAARQAGTT